jgi:hypothetical protein
MIHGVRLAITSTARSERRIAVRRPGVGIDASSASADPARAPQMQAYMKSTMPYFGVSLPMTRQIARTAATRYPPADVADLVCRARGKINPRHRRAAAWWPPILLLYVQP